MRGRGGQAVHTQPRVSGVHRLSRVRRAPLGAVGAGVSPLTQGRLGVMAEEGPGETEVRWGEPGPPAQLGQGLHGGMGGGCGCHPSAQGPPPAPWPPFPPGLAQDGCCHGAVEWKWGSGKAQDPHLPPIPPWGWDRVMELSLGRDPGPSQTPVGQVGTHSFLG